jgi:hypothetical protein
MTALHDNPGLVIGRLEEIEQDLAHRMLDYESAATDYAHAKRDWEKKLAQCQIVASGPNSETRRANALLAAVASDDTYENLKLAEGAFEGTKAVVKVLETRAMIGMAILRSQGRS